MPFDLSIQDIEEIQAQDNENESLESEREATLQFEEDVMNEFFDMNKFITDGNETNQAQETTPDNDSWDVDEFL